MNIDEYLAKKPSRRSIAAKIEKAEIAIEDAEEIIERLSEYLDEKEHEESNEEAEEEDRVIARSTRRRPTELDQLGAVLKTIPSLLSIWLRKHP